MLVCAALKPYPSRAMRSVLNKMTTRIHGSKASRLTRRNAAARHAFSGQPSRLRGQSASHCSMVSTQSRCRSVSITPAPSCLALMSLKVETRTPAMRLSSTKAPTKIQMRKKRARPSECSGCGATSAPTASMLAKSTVVHPSNDETSMSTSAAAKKLSKEPHTGFDHAYPCASHCARVVNRSGSCSHACSAPASSCTARMAKIERKKRYT